MEEKTKERLASLEAKVEILLDLLKEIKEDLKNHPSREEYSNVKEAVEDVQKELEKLKNSYYKIMIKVGVVSGILGFVAELIFRYLVK